MPNKIATVETRNILRLLNEMQKNNRKKERNVNKCLLRQAERQGFEPWVPVKSTTVFETAPIDHSGISPKSAAKIDKKKRMTKFCRTLLVF